ncbi:MAG: 4-hydroxyphenylpyruvate dioxygenase [Gammaproteobacteria bacterium]|jgi:4-hydroxyphenylpyruvate dioxygenase|nr:4-hydroxyphenylpyruvate dioxygenase [Gammaproteobacteria bacterium]
MARSNTPTCSSYLKQQQIDMILTSPILGESRASKHITIHGDGFSDIAFSVKDTEKAFSNAVKHGAKPISEPNTYEVIGRKIRASQVSTIGNIIHTLVEAPGKETDFYLGLHGKSETLNDSSQHPMLKRIDHIAICVETGSLEKSVEMYMNAFGLIKTHAESVDTGKSGMNSIVLQSPDSVVKLVFTESMPQYEKSQIKEFLNFNHGPGVQHIAFETDDIIRAVEILKKNGLSFLKVPKEYYSVRLAELPELEEEIQKIDGTNILIDQDENGYLYQLFTLPVQTRPTGFFEIIQRVGAKGFGSSNIKSLFKSIELEQRNRGTF